MTSHYFVLQSSMAWTQLIIIQKTITMIGIQELVDGGWDYLPMTPMKKNIEKLVAL